jgi:hypothetical protein
MIMMILYHDAGHTHCSTTRTFDALHVEELSLFIGLYYYLAEHYARSQHLTKITDGRETATSPVKANRQG